MAVAMVIIDANASLYAGTANARAAMCAKVVRKRVRREAAAGWSSPLLKLLGAEMSACHCLPGLTWDNTFVSRSQLHH